MLLPSWPQIRRSTAFKLTVVAVISYIFYLLAGFLLPVLLAVGLAFILYPLVDYIQKVRMAHGMIQLSRAVAIILAILAFLACLMVVIGFIILPLFGQMNAFIQRLPQLAGSSEIQSIEQMLADPSKIPLLPSNFDMLIEDVLKWSMSFVGDLLRNLLKSSLDIVSNLIGLLVVPFLAYYFMQDWQELRRMFINFFNYEAQAKAGQVIDEIGASISSYVRGMVKLSLLSGFVITIGMMILGVQFPLVFGFWAILAETVPVVGPMVGAVPAIVIAYGQSPEQAVHVAVFYLVYYQLDSHWLLPKLMGKTINLHPALVIVALLIGAKLFGILGMVFAVPVAAVYRVLYKELWHEGEENQL